MSTRRRLLVGLIFLCSASALAQSKGNTPLQITTTSLPSATLGVPYNQTLQATGGKTPYRWSIRSGQLPEGVTLDAAKGTVAGTPLTAGAFTFVVEVQDRTKSKASKSL